MYFRTLVFFFFISIHAWSQSPNDNIENRKKIFQDSPIESFTNGNTVQWNCVDEKLTGKCIKYHNDQWYYFTALDAPRQYINISGQDCRDLWGVQLVVIEGVPCETETYEIKACISLETQDDIFATVDNLTPGKQYLLNVDGYLHDFCSFKMELSLTPKGLPVFQEIQVEASDVVQNDTLQYSWETPDSLLTGITSYKLYRMKAGDVRFSFLKEFPSRQDAFGVLRKSYNYSEVVLPESNPWIYKLVAITGEFSYIVDEFSASANWLKTVKTRYKIVPEISYRKRAKLLITLMDYVPGVPLKEMNIEYYPRDFRPIYFDVTEYIELGVTRFQIIIKNIETGNREVVDYEYVKGVGLEKKR